MGGPPVRVGPVWVFWLAQLTRIARDPSHSPFIVAIAWSASARSLKVSDLLVRCTQPEPT